MDERTRTEIEAAVFRRLIAHLQGRTDTQNIDLMNLAGFCRNCLGNWYEEAARASGAGTIVGGDLGCLLNIEGRLRRTGDHTTRVAHFAELIAGEEG